MNTVTFPEFLQTMLANCPRTGDGVHRWLYCTARQLHVHLSDKRELADLLEACAANCGRHVPRREIEAAVLNSQQTAWQPNGIGRPKSTVPVKLWPSVNRERREAIVHDALGLAGLWEASPVRIEDNDQHTEAIIDQLFAGNPLLCCGQSSSVFDTRPREDWHGKLAGLQLIVPSPMSSVTGLTKDGRESKHTLSNTGPRRFLICEFDSGCTNDHAALLLHLATFAPLVCALHSGGRSLHGWFFTAGQPDNRVAHFFRYAVSLGADPATWTRSQFVRMPDGLRENGKRQTVYFLNFKPLGVTI